MKFLLSILVLVASASAMTFSNVFLEEWESFKMKHDKIYSSPIEERFRMKIFAENKMKVAAHNVKYYSGEESFEVGLNKYSDMLHNEFASIMNGFRQQYEVDQERDGYTYIGPDEDVMMPDQVDWRTKGAVTPVKDQGQCGSCWAFSATGSLEGQHFRKTGKLVSLSEQNLVECTLNYSSNTHFNNNGCNGGFMDNAFRYIKLNGGIDTEESYPYLANDTEKCHFNPETVGADDIGFTDIESGNENLLKKAVATVGPIAVAIDANSEEFQSYKQGVYFNKDCSDIILDHGVLVVGYGTTEDGVDYWLVKNSWGTTWGDKGYLKMARNQNNNCGIASMASFPIV